MLNKMSAKQLTETMNKQFNGGLSKSIGKTARDIIFLASKLAEAENKMLKMIEAFPEYLDKSEAALCCNLSYNLNPTEDLLKWHKRVNRRIFRNAYLKELAQIDAPDWTKLQLK